MSGIHRDTHSSGPSRSEPYGRHRYEPRHNDEDNRRGTPSKDSYPGPVNGQRDNGWGRRAQRAALPPAVPRTPPSSSQLHQGPTACDKNSGSNAAQPNYGWAPSTTTNPHLQASSRIPASEDPRRPRPVPGPYHEEMCRPPPPPQVTSSRPPMPEIRRDERKLEYLINATDRRFETYQHDTRRRWAKSDLELVLRMLEESRAVKPDLYLAMRALNTAVATFRIITTGYEKDQVEPGLEDTFHAFRTQVQNLVFDLCEADDSKIRKKAYPAVLKLSLADLNLARSNCSALVQLLQNDKSDGELETVQDVLTRHLELWRSICLPIIIDEWCFSDLRPRILDFLSTPGAHDALAAIIDDGPAEADLALRLARVLPMCKQQEFSKIADLLFPLTKLWPEADASVPDEEKRLARDAGVAVLWNVTKVLMRRGKTLAFSDRGDDAFPDHLRFLDTERQAEGPSACTAPVILGGDILLNNLINITLRIGVSEGEGECDGRLVTETEPSEAGRFTKDLEDSARYIFCFLPVGGHLREDNSPQDTAAGALHHFSPLQRIVFFRSIANSATKISTAAVHCPPELGFSGEATVSDLAMVTSQALLDYVPLEGMAIRGSSQRRATDVRSDAHDSYLILAAEALLVAIHQCESYLLAHTSKHVQNDPRMRDKVRALTRLAEGITQQKNVPEQVLESAIILSALGAAYFKVRSKNADLAMPKWLMPPPPIPAWEPSSARKATLESSKESATKGSGSTHKRRRSKESAAKETRDSDDTSKGRRVRGRGAVHATFDGAVDNGWPTLPSPRSAASRSSADTGIAVRGASSADDSRSSIVRPIDTYRPSEKVSRADANRWSRVNSPPAHSRSKGEESPRKPQRAEQDSPRSPERKDHEASRQSHHYGSRNSVQERWSR